jgi:hypothetical protein
VITNFWDEKGVIGVNAARYTEVRQKSECSPSSKSYQNNSVIIDTPP